MVNKSRLIPIEHRVETQWEELVLIRSLDRLLPVFVYQHIVHVEEIGKALLVVVSPAHVALLLGDHLPNVLENERSDWYLFHGEKTPHVNSLCFLFFLSGVVLRLRLSYFFSDSLNQEFVAPLVCRVHEEVLTEVFVAGAGGVALIEGEDLVDALECTRLDGDHLATTRAQLLIIRRIEQLLVPAVAGAAPTGLTAVRAPAETRALRLLQVRGNVLVVDEIILDIVPDDRFSPWILEARLIRVCLINTIVPEKPRNHLLTIILHILLQVSQPDERVIRFVFEVAGNDFDVLFDRDGDCWLGWEDLVFGGPVLRIEEFEDVAHAYFEVVLDGLFAESFGWQSFHLLKMSMSQRQSEIEFLIHLFWSFKRPIYQIIFLHTWRTALV